MNTFIRHIKFSLIFMALTLMFLPAASYSETAKTIYISPFNIHAKKDISFLKDAMRAMMSSRLAADAKLKIVEDESKADYTLYGDITAIGNSLSINAKINATDGSVPEATYYTSAATENDIIPAVDLLAAKISQQSFFGKNQTTPETAASQSAPLVPTTEKSKDTDFQTAHPDRAFLTPVPVTGTTPVGSPSPIITSEPARLQPGQPGSGFVTPQTITTNQGFQKTRNFPVSMQDIAVGDIDGDGTDDLIVASTTEIFAYQMAGTNLAPFGQISLPTSQKIISMEMVDLDNNGLSEIYITSVSRNHRPNAMAVRWENNRFSYIFQNQRWFIKPVSVPGRGKILAGQRRGIEYPMSKGIYELTVQDGQLTKLNQLTVPAGTNVYNFAMADLDGDGVTEVIMLDDNDKLHVTMAGGRQLWVGDDYYGGSLRFIGGKSATRKKGGHIKQPVNEENDTSRDRMYIHSRIIIADVNNDHQPDVIINKNLSSASRLFKNFKAYPSGEIHALSWTGIGLSELWRTQKINGYVASYDFRKEPDSPNAKLYVGLVINSGWMDVLSAKDSTVLIYPLKIQEQ